MINFDLQGLEQNESGTLAPDFSFTKIQPNLAALEETRKYRIIENLIIIGRGGSVSTFRAFWEGLGINKYQKKVYIIDTADPDFINSVRKKASAQSSLVIAISKSGNTIDVIENLLCFSGYQTVVITSRTQDNALFGFASKKGFQVIDHQEIGGRYSGLTEVSLVPATICGFQVEEIIKGGGEGYKKFTVTGNEAEKLALIVKYYARKGLSEIFWPIYSKGLVAFSELIMQLIHESVAKNQQGLSVMPVEAPESQHHSNQRFFGGPQNMFGIFTTLKNFESSLTIAVPEDLASIEANSLKLEQLNGITVGKTMEFEFLGTFAEAKNRNIPSVLIELERLDEYHLGYFTAFLHCFTVYLATAFNANPYDQPQVEGSKKISLTLRSGYRTNN